MRIQKAIFYADSGDYFEMLYWNIFIKECSDGVKRLEKCTENFVECTENWAFIRGHPILPLSSIKFIFLINLLNQ